MSKDLVASESVVNEARQGLLKAMLQHSVARVAPRFSSKPIQVDESAPKQPDSLQELPDSSIRDSASRPRSSLTQSEKQYLEGLLQSGDPNAIRRASLKLADKQVFPPLVEPLQDNERRPRLKRRNSSLQQELYRLHEMGSVKPSTVLQRMGSYQTQSIVADEQPEEASWDMMEDEEVTPDKQRWNPFVDISSWLYGNQGVEVNHDGSPLPTTSSPFQILGTDADDVSCHPHVLSPPLMEGIQAFVPDSLSDRHHFWLKYSVVRDGANLQKCLRHIRASRYTIWAIETTEGHVFGSFTSEPWRLHGESFFGSPESFVWRMRRSRFCNASSIVEKAVMEGELDVYPYRGCNSAIQYCSCDKIALGQGALELGTSSDHYGYAICLNASLQSGSTSSSETFGNPCLISKDKDGAEFEVANVEVWTLTNCETVVEAETAEMRSLFLEETTPRAGPRSGDLDVLQILVGSPS